MRNSVCKGEKLSKFGKSEIATFRCYSEIVQANWKELKTSTYLQGSPRVIVIASTVDKHLPVHEAAAETKKSSEDSKDSSDRCPRTLLHSSHRSWTTLATPTSYSKMVHMLALQAVQGPATPHIWKEAPHQRSKSHIPCSEPIKLILIVLSMQDKDSVRQRW